jgi:hypothetical protein
MYKTVDYLNLYSNKFLLRLGIRYGKVRFSDINLNIKKLDKKSKIIVNKFLELDKYMKNNINLDKLVKCYGKYFNPNILNIPYDFIDYNLVIRAKNDVDKKIKDLESYDLLLLTVENIEKRTNLFILTKILDSLIDIKVVENNCLLLFS